MPESYGVTATTASSQSCSLAPAPDDDALLQQLATLDNVHATLAEGLSGKLGLYDVQIDGHSSRMTRSELESLATCFASPVAHADPVLDRGAESIGNNSSNTKTALSSPTPAASASGGSTAPSNAAATNSSSAHAAAEPVDARQRAVEAIRDVLDTVEEVHAYDYGRMGLSNLSRQRFIADQLVALGERASGRTTCSAKVDPDDRRKMFDLGASIMADRLGMNKAFAGAASAGDARARQMDDRQLRAWSDGSQSTRPQREAYLQRLEVERTLRTLSNIEGGLGGAIGAAVGGHEGSDMGAAFDGVATAFGGTYQARDNLRVVTAADNRPRIDPPANRGQAPEKSDPRQNQPGSPTRARVDAPKTGDARYWQQTRATSSNPMEGRSVGTRDVTDIGSARKIGNPGGPGGPTAPAGGAANDNRGADASQQQAQVPRRLAVGDSGAGGPPDVRAIKATASKPPGRNGNDGKEPPREPSILRYPPSTSVNDAGAGKPADAGTTQASVDAAGKAASADAAAAQAPGKPMWTPDSLMRGSRYTPSQTVVYRGTVERLAKLMENKAFDWARDPTDPIIVDRNGVVFQGHHRIMAARLAKMPIPPEAIKVVDIPGGRDPRPWGSVTVRDGERPQQR